MTKTYESPDRGGTVFERIVGTLARQQIKISGPHYLARWHEFRDILRLAEDNITLNNALEKVEMLYRLIRDEQ